MSKKINYVFCRNCRASGSLSSLMTNDGEIFYICTICDSDETIFHQELDQGTDNGVRLASTVMEVIA